MQFDAYELDPAQDVQELSSGCPRVDTRNSGMEPPHMSGVVPLIVPSQTVADGASRG